MDPSPSNWNGPAVHAALAARAAAGAPDGFRGREGHLGDVLRPALGEPEVRAFEQRHGVRLPPSYRAFLIEVGDGGAGPGFGVLGLEQLPEDEEEALYGERVDCLRPGFLAAPFPYRAAVPRPPRETLCPPGALVITDYGGGDYARLVVNGPCAGQVWHDDQVWAGLTPGPDFHTWYTRWLDLLP
ncbi:SMI1/KNR4 family protein [Kitasatospora terrestris]|uniref:SMI1/KNR4 family protein n=1 Tax=Kitasatospora terrestris TaxID=258051 RepID=A0ABP9DFA0_9ACTN